MFSRYQGSSLGVRWQVEKLTTHLHLVLRLRNCVAIPPLSTSTTGFTNDLENCPGGNFYRTVICFMQCKTVEIKVYSLPCYEKTLKVAVVLQNCCNLLKVVVGSYSKICHAGVQGVNIKVKEFAEVEGEMSPVPIKA
jgi:hypothetical protein